MLFQPGSRHSGALQAQAAMPAQLARLLTTNSFSTGRCSMTWPGQEGTGAWQLSKLCRHANAAEDSALPALENQEDTTATALHNGLPPQSSPASHAIQHHPPPTCSTRSFTTGRSSTWGVGEARWGRRSGRGGEDRRGKPSSVTRRASPADPGAQHAKQDSSPPAAHRNSFLHPIKRYPWPSPW